MIIIILSDHQHNEGGEVSPGHRDAGHCGPLPGAQSGLRQWGGQQISEQCGGQLRPGGGAETRWGWIKLQLWFNFILLTLLHYWHVTNSLPLVSKFGHKTHPSTFLLCFLMKLKIDEMPEKVTEDVTSRGWHTFSDFWPIRSRDILTNQNPLNLCAAVFETDRLCQFLSKYFTHRKIRLPKNRLLDAFSL